MVDSSDPTDGVAKPTDRTEESVFPIGALINAVAIALGGGALMLVYALLTGMSHNFSFSTRRFDHVWYAGVALLLWAGWLFASIANRARRIPPPHRTWLVFCGIIVSHVLAAATALFNLWALATTAFGLHP